MLQDPIGFKKAMLDAKHEFEVDMARGPVPPSPPLRAAPDAPHRRGSPTARRRHVLGQRPAAGTGRDRRAGRAADPRRATMSPDEVTRTLASLADLRDRGAISPEEYEAKKADLLGRL